MSISLIAEACALRGISSHMLQVPKGFTAEPFWVLRVEVWKWEATHDVEFSFWRPYDEVALLTAGQRHLLVVLEISLVRLTSLPAVIPHQFLQFQFLQPLSRSRNIRIFFVT